MIKRIYIDLDETTVDLCTKWSYYHRNRYGSDYTRDTVPYGRAEDEKEGQQWIDFLRIPGFMADLPFMERRTQEVLYILSRQYRIIPVTRAVAWESARDKYSWVHTHLRIPGIVKSMSDLIITGAKDCLDPTDAVLIDDDPRHLNTFKGHKICYARPWNKPWRKGTFSGQVLGHDGQPLQTWVDSWDGVIPALRTMNSRIEWEKADRVVRP